MDKLAEKMAELAERFGPSVIDAARGAVRVEAMSMMMSSVIATLIALAMLAGARFLWNYQTVEKFEAGVPRVFAMIILTCATIPAVIAIWNLIDPWTWTAITNPDLYLAKKIFKL